MQKLVLLTILILLCGVGYIGFSILTFESDVQRHYDLTAQLPENDHFMQEAGDIVLSSTDQTQKEQILKIVKETISQYDQSWERLPTQTRTIQSTFLGAIKRGKLPVFYPVSRFINPTMVAKQEYKMLAPLSIALDQVSENADENTVSSATCTDKNTGLIFGDTGDNILTCNKEEQGYVRFILSGPGKDTITVRGNNIIGAGTGDDLIQAGPELTMIYVEPNFGADNIQIDCRRSQINIENDEKLTRLPWTHDFVHFIVFDPRIAKEDIIITENMIHQKHTANRIMLNENCFNIVFTSEG